MIFSVCLIFGPQINVKFDSHILGPTFLDGLIVGFIR